MNKKPSAREAKVVGPTVPILPPLAARLPDFIGAGAAPAGSLSGLSLAFVGVGSVGLPLVAHCARLSPAEIIIADPKILKPESRLTHPIPPSAVGRSKAAYAARRCKQISPATRVRWLEGTVQQLSLDVLAKVDVAFMATDQLGAEVESGQIFRHLGRPLIHASVLGCNLMANVRFFSNAPKAPCPACAFGPAEWAQLNSETVFSCEGTGSATAMSLNTAPTRSLSFLCSTAADLAMMQFLRHRLKLGTPVADTNLEYCAYTHRCASAPLVFNPDCPCDHAPFARSSLPRPVAESTLRELVAFSGLNVPPSLDGVTVGIDRLHWLESGVCACAAPHPFRRFAPTDGAQAGRCARCRQPIRPQPFFTHPVALMPLLTAVLDRPLRTLGAGRARWALVRRNDRAVLLHHPNQTKKT